MKRGNEENGKKREKTKTKKTPTTPTVVPRDWQKVVLRATGLCFSIVVVIMTHTNTPRMLSGNLLQLKMTETESNHAGTSEKGLEEFLSLKLNGRAQVLKKQRHTIVPSPTLYLAQCSQISSVSLATTKPRLIHQITRQREQHESSLQKTPLL